MKVLEWIGVIGGRRFYTNPAEVSDMVTLLWCRHEKKRVGTEACGCHTLQVCRHDNNNINNNNRATQYQTCECTSSKSHQDFVEISCNRVRKWDAMTQFLHKLHWRRTSARCMTSGRQSALWRQQRETTGTSWWTYFQSLQKRHFVEVRLKMWHARLQLPLTQQQFRNFAVNDVTEWFWIGFKGTERREGCVNMTALCYNSDWKQTKFRPSSTKAIKLMKTYRSGRGRYCFEIATFSSTRSEVGCKRA